MECLWRLRCYRQPYGYCYQPYPSILHVHFHPYDGFPYYHLYGAGLLEKYAQVYMGSEEKSVVLFVRDPAELIINN